ALSSSLVSDGDTVVATVTAVDAHGNDLGDVTADATLTSDIDGDTIAAGTVTVSGTGTHTITATIGSATDAATVTVAPVPVLIITPADETVAAGGSVQFVASRAALLVTTDVTPTTVFTSSNTSDT